MSSMPLSSKPLAAPEGDSPGAVLGNQSAPMEGIVFDGVRVRFGGGAARGAFPWGRRYRCEHAQVRSVGGTSPAPECAS